jgi:hypothetical protein
MLVYPITDSNLYPTLVAALRDMRHANGRDETTGEGGGNISWVGLSIGMIVLDTLTREDEGVADRWKRLLSAHEVSEEDADIIYALRNSMLHGYGVPRPAGNMVAPSCLPATLPGMRSIPPGAARRW